MGRALMSPREGREGGRSACCLCPPSAASSICVLAPRLLLLSSPPASAHSRPEPQWCLGELLGKVFSPGSCSALLTLKMPLCKEKGASLPCLQNPFRSGVPFTYPPQLQTLTQKLGPGLVGAERLCLLSVLAQQAEPGRAGQGAVELGWDVVLNLSPVCGRKDGPEHPAS